MKSLSSIGEVFRVMASPYADMVWVVPVLHSKNIIGSDIHVYVV